MQQLVMNFQQKHGKKVPLLKLYGDKDSSEDEGLKLADGTTVGKKAAGSAGGSGRGKPRKKPAASSSSSGATTSGGGGGPSTSGSGGVAGSGGKKQGRDDDDDDDPNKHRKMRSEGGPPKPAVARKEPRKKGTVYPPVDPSLPVLYISHQKERTLLGYRVLDWMDEQKRKIHEAKMQGRQVKPHWYRVGTAALKDIRHFQKTSALLI